MTNQNLNKVLKQKFDSLERAYINLLGSQEAKLLLSYTNSYNRIKKKIAEVYENFGDKPTITELRKFNRLQNIEKDLIESIKELESELKVYISKQRKYSLIIGKRDTADVINNISGVHFVNTNYPKEQIIKYLEDNLWYDALKETSAKLFNDIKRNFETLLRANAKEEIISGVIEGMSLRELAKTISERFDVSYNRAKVIALTETHKFYNIGRNDSINEAIEKASNVFDTKAYKVWRHNGIGKPRAEHLAADGQIANEEGYFDVGGELLQAPGLGTDPGNNINCHCTIDFVLELT